VGQPVLVREPCVWCGRKTALWGILSNGDLVPFCRRCHPGNSKEDLRWLAEAMARLERMQVNHRPVAVAPDPPADRECGPGDFVLWCLWRLLPPWGRVVVWCVVAAGLTFAGGEFVFGVLLMTGVVR